MKTTTLKAGLLALSLFTFLSIGAQEKKEPDFDKMFKKSDANADGSISLEEFKAVKRKNEVPVEKLEKKFANLDANSDGAVTREELEEGWKKGKDKPKEKKE